MVAKKDVTRQQQTKTVAPPAKKAKTDAAKKPKSDSALDAVAEGIDQVEGLTEHCRHMLLATIPGCLGVAADERRDSQKMCVGMIAEALESVEVSLRAAVDTEVMNVAVVEGSKLSLEEDLHSKRVAGLAAAELVQKKEAEYVEISKAAVAAKSTLSEAKTAQCNCEASQKESRDGKDTIDHAIEVDLKAILDGESEVSQLKMHYGKLTAIVRTLSLESSLVIALPASCAKAKANRGAFDEIVLKQLEKSMQTRAAELAKLFEPFFASTQACNAAVEVAETELDAAVEAQQIIAEAVKSLAASQKEACAAADAADAAVIQYQINCQKAVDAKENKVKALDRFKEHNMGCFNSLRDKLSKEAAASAAVETETVAEIVGQVLLEEPRTVGGA